MGILPIYFIQPKHTLAYKMPRKALVSQSKIPPGLLLEIKGGLAYALLRFTDLPGRTWLYPNADPQSQNSESGSNLYPVQ